MRYIDHGDIWIQRISSIEIEKREQVEVQVKYWFDKTKLGVIESLAQERKIKATD